MTPLRLPLILFLFCTILPFVTQSQTPGSPVDHMAAFTTLEEELRKNYLSYLSEVAHGQRVRKMERRRTDLITSLGDAIRAGGRVKLYNGDAALRDAFVQYWKVLLNIFREDYHKIVDMEEVAERSYDAMEAYLLIQEKADERRNHAYDSVVSAYQSFAARHRVTLTEDQKNKITLKLEQAGKVNVYVNTVFLIFFKSAVHENNVAEALKANNISAIEQSKNALAKYAREGLSRLDTIKPYKNDGSLVTACRKALEFHVIEAEKKIPPLSEFLIKAGEFDKIKKSFESQSPGSRTKENIDAYNKAVNDINAHAQAYNKNSEELFNARVKVITTWAQARKRFMHQHMPYK